MSPEVWVAITWVSCGQQRGGSGAPALLEFPAVQPVSMRDDEVELRLDASISGFADRVPLMSARNLVSRGQRNFLVGLLFAGFIGLVVNVQLMITGDHCLLHLALSGRRRLPVVPLHSVLEERRPRDRDRRGSPEGPGLRIALLYDSAPRLQRILGHHQAD